MFTGTGTALITPFTEEGLIDWDALAILVEEQGGVDFIVPCGTTGESSTLTHAEHGGVIEFVVIRAAGRIPVLAGTGSNSTQEAVALTQAAKQVGADGALVVSPYYNKPSQAGILDYYRQVAKAGLPIILYDIPGRCGGQGVTAETILTLAKEGAIIGLKWASGNWEQLQDVLANGSKEFIVLAGDDNLTYPAMCLGAMGVISVLANLRPKDMVALTCAMNTGHHDHGRKLHYKMRPLMQAMFIETNPVPVKTAMAMIYPEVFQEIFRSPLVPMEGTNRTRLKHLLKQCGILK